MPRWLAGEFFDVVVPTDGLDRCCRLARVLFRPYLKAHLEMNRNWRNMSRVHYVPIEQPPLPTFVDSQWLARHFEQFNLNTHRALVWRMRSLAQHGDAA